MKDLPEKLGKYDILGEAGRGSMGVVYHGHDPFVDRKVAIKVLLAPEAAEADTSRARRLFFNEAQAAGALDHPNILRVYDAGEVDGQPYMVMEYVEGAENLRPYCRPDNLLPVPRVLELMAECASALDYAHQRGVTHRDIKPANLMLTPAGMVKIVDFGIAQRTTTDRTQILGVAGSPRYMSPEQARDEKITPQSDLYSLGVVMYELLSGQPPHRASELPSLMYKLLHEEPVPLDMLRPDLPERVAAIVHHALAKDREARYRSGAELQADLLQFLRAEGGADALGEDQQLALLRDLPLLAELRDADLQALLKAGAWERRPPGDTLTVQGRHDQALLFLVKGRARVERDGTQVALLEAGSCVGEMAYLTGSARSATVTTLTEAEVLRIAEPLSRWAALPLQLRLGRALQQVLAERLAAATRALAARQG